MSKARNEIGSGVKYRNRIELQESTRKKLKDKFLQKRNFQLEENKEKGEVTAKNYNKEKGGKEALKKST